MSEKEEKKSGIPGFPSDIPAKQPGMAQKDAEKPLKSGKKGRKRAKSADSDGYGNVFEAFGQRGTYMGMEQGYGAEISDEWRLFYSQREPVGH